jgi:SHS2 domain-containing protein
MVRCLIIFQADTHTKSLINLLDKVEYITDSETMVASDMWSEQTC